jgi:hypothetical protein
VVWINWVPSNDVSINFKEDGKRCSDTTEAPVGFKMSENCYITDFISLGGTSSLKFNEAGTFKYQVEVPGETKTGGPLGVGFGKVEGKGEIIVE